MPHFRSENLNPRSACLAAVAWLALCGAAPAQRPVHYEHAGVLAPGAIGRQQLARGGPMPGYFQPVHVRGPVGSEVSFVYEGRFDFAQPSPATTALLVGQVYRLRVTNIPRHEGEELYPTIELINRLYPPIGQELKFPVPIELTQEDLEAAFAGQLITRIVYIEDPRAAYARAEDPDHQTTVEANPQHDPLAVADRLGRPMAIVRIGGRTPDDPSNPDAAFLFHSPPLLLFQPRGE